MTKNLWLLVGIGGFVLVVLGLLALPPYGRRTGADTGRADASGETCTRCFRPGHKPADCPYTALATLYSEVAVRLDHAREGRFCDGSANSELDRVLNRALNAGLAIKTTYQQPPIEQPTVYALLELLQALRAKAQDDFKDTEWKELRDRTAEIQVNREIFVPLKEVAGKLLDWLEVQSRMSETIREAEGYAKNNNDEDAYRTFAKVREDSVYAAVAHKRREEIRGRIQDRRTREVDTKMAATEYEAALKLINETLALLGADYADFTAEMLPRQTECLKFMGTQRTLDDVAQRIREGELDGARHRLDEIPRELLRVEWIKKRVVGLEDEIATQSLLSKATRMYDEGQGEAAVQLLTSRLGSLREDGRKLLDRIQKVVHAHKDFSEARERNDWQHALERIDAICDLEKNAENWYRKDADGAVTCRGTEAPGTSGKAYDLALKLRSEGDALESGARVLFDEGKMAEALARCDEAAKKFAGAREGFQKARIFIAGSSEEIKKLFKDAERAYNLVRNLNLPIGRRLGLLRIALAKLSASGGNDEKAKRAEIAGLIEKLEAERDK